MVWKKIFEGRFASKTDGSEVFYVSDIQDWGLQVKDLQFVLEYTGRGTTGVKVSFAVEDGARNDVNALTNTVSVLAQLAVTGQLPSQRRGSIPTYAVPYFRGKLGVAGSAAAEDYVELTVWAGGKAY